MLQSISQTGRRPLNILFRGETNAQRDLVTCQRHIASRIIDGVPTVGECVGPLRARLST